MKENGNILEFDYEAAEMKIKELQTHRASLAIEISKNKAQAEELRNQLSFYEKKIEEHRLLKASVLREVDQKIAESEKLDATLRSLRIQVEYENIDKESRLKAIESERSELALEKASFKERSEMKENDLSIREKEIYLLEQSLSEKHKQADARLIEVQSREERVLKQELACHDKVVQSEAMMKEAEIKKTEAIKLLDQGQSVEKMASDKVRDINLHREDLIKREHAVKVENQLIDEKKKQIRQDERDIQMEKNKLSTLRSRLLKEIENAAIETHIKAEFIKEVSNEEEPE